MEAIQHASPRRRKDNSARSNIILSVVVHAVFAAAAAYWAAHEGVLGKKMQELSVLLVPKEKKPEPEKPKEEAKPAETKPAETRRAERSETKPAQPAPPPPARALAPPPLSAPPPAVLPSFSLGAEIAAGEDPVATYKTYVENTLRARWNRPVDVDDRLFVAEARLELDGTGQLKGYEWLQGSGHADWDASVRRTLDETRAIGRKPPASFPGRFVVRFDAVATSEPLSIQ